MKGISVKTLIVFSIFVFMFSSCQKDEIELEDFTADETVALKSATADNNFMVITKSETLPKGFEKKLGKYGEVVRTIPEIGVVVVKSTSSNFEKKVGKIADIKAVVPDIIVQCIEPDNYVLEANPSSIGDGEWFLKEQWGLDAIDAQEAWDAGYTGAGARVFILDSGIDAEHPDLAPNLNTALCTSFIENEGYNIRDLISPFFNHGTHVAGIVAAADNQMGIIGVAPLAEIVAVKVLSEYSGSGPFSGINAGIVYAANNGADVINMSLGATLSKKGLYIDEKGKIKKIPSVYVQYYVLAQKRAIDYAYKNGVVIVTSAGNDGINADGNGSNIILPADLEKVISVSATAPDYIYNSYMNGDYNPNLDIPASYTNYGKSLINIAAPGGDFDFYDSPGWINDMVLSASGQGWYWWSAGTSMAAPHVAGVAALIIAKNGGEMSPVEVKKQLYKTADKIDGNGNSAYFGNGRVNAFRAVTE